jgi:hypothetical protein
MSISKFREFIAWEKQDPCSSSWVSPNHQYFFLGLGKTASTRVKLSLHILEGYEVIAEPFPWLHARSDSQESFVSKLSDFSSDQAIEILTSPEWFRFCFVRNPYDRLFAAYKSNIMQEMDPPSPYYTQVKDKIRDLFDYEGRTNKPNAVISFADFVSYVEQTVAHIPDYHWSPISWGLRPDLIDYDFVGYVENFEADFKTVLQRLNVTDEIMPDLLKPVNQSSVQGIPLSAVYSWDLAERVYNIYKDDFESYGYEKDSWLFM